MDKKIYDILRIMRVLPDKRKVNQHEKAHILGIPSIYLKYPDGSMDLVFTEENLITTASKQSLLLPIYQAGVTSDPVTSLQIGTGGSIDPQGLYPKQEDPAALGLNTSLLSVATTFTTSTSDVSVTFIADIDQGSANNHIITEAGLFKQSGKIFNIKNFPGISKTSDFAIHFQWIVKYA